MENSSTRLAIYVTLMTLGVVLMLLGISWLMFLGVALIMLGSLSSSQKPRSRSLALSLIYAVMAVVVLILDLLKGDAFVLKTRPLWFWIGVVGAWVLGVITEFQKWRKGAVSHGA